MGDDFYYAECDTRTNSKNPKCKVTVEIPVAHDAPIFKKSCDVSVSGPGNSDRVYFFEYLLPLNHTNVLFIEYDYKRKMSNYTFNQDD